MNYIQDLTAVKISNIVITKSIIHCLNTVDFSSFLNIRTLNVTDSLIEQIFCPHSDVNILNNIEHLNLTNNRLQYLGQSLSKLNKLKSLDLSSNLLTEQQRPDHFQARSI